MKRKYGLRINGKEVTPAEFHRRNKIGGEGIPMISKTYTDAKPWVSESSGVLPHQVQEARELLAKEKSRGKLTAVRILDSGAVECTARGDAGRRGWCKFRGSVDGDGGYGETYNSQT